MNTKETLSNSLLLIHVEVCAVQFLPVLEIDPCHLYPEMLHSASHLSCLILCSLLCLLSLLALHLSLQKFT